MRYLLRRFACEQSAATAVEYGLIATLIAAALIIGATALGGQLNLVFNGISTKLASP